MGAGEVGSAAAVTATDLQYSFTGEAARLRGGGVIKLERVAAGFVGLFQFQPQWRVFFVAVVHHHDVVGGEPAGHPWVAVLGHRGKKLPTDGVVQPADVQPFFEGHGLSLPNAEVCWMRISKN